MDFKELTDYIKSLGFRERQVELPVYDCKRSDKGKNCEDCIGKKCEHYEAEYGIDYFLKVPKGELVIDITSESFGVVYLCANVSKTLPPALISIDGHSGYKGWNYAGRYQGEKFKKELSKEIEFWKKYE